MEHNYRERLSKIAHVILQEPIDYGALYHSLHEMKRIFLEVSQMDSDQQNYRQDIKHETGKAIGPEWAALCIDDLMRTKRFISGTYKAIRKVLYDCPDKPVTLLYVGTGPFATLITAISTLFTPAQLQLVLVEINPISLAGLKNCIKNFGMENYVKAIHSCDAVTFQPENAHDIDILLLECLQYALVKEQQVPITHHLIPQLREDIIMIPQAINLSVCLIDHKAKVQYIENGGSDRSYFTKKINPVFSLTKESIKANPANAAGNIDFPLVTTSLEDIPENYSSIAIATEIDVFDDQKLLMEECSLTMHYKHMPIENVAAYKAMTTQYSIGEVPGLDINYLVH